MSDQRTYVAWARTRRGWRVIALGPSLEAADESLRQWISGQRRPPMASAVLPRGVRPERRRDHA